MTTGEKIKMLCKESKITQKKLSEMIGFTEAGMTRWIKEERKINVNALIKIAQIFDVSTDWLLGLSDRRNYNGMISGDDIMDYCEKASEIAGGQMAKCTNDYDAYKYFEHVYCTWKYTIPSAIHSIADGTWKDGGSCE